MHAATTEDIAQRIISETDSALCRVLRHHWEPEDVTVHGLWARQTLMCQKCGTQRIFHVHLRTGEIGRSHYRYRRYRPEGMTAMTAEDRGQLRLRVLLGDSR